MSTSAKTRLVDPHTALVEASLLAVGQLPGVVAWKNTTGVGRSLASDRKIRFGLNGSSDLLAVVAPHGRFLGMEMKTGGAVQSKQQKAFQRAIEDLGGVYVVVRQVADALAGVELARRAP